MVARVFAVCALVLAWLCCPKAVLAQTIQSINEATDISRLHDDPNRAEGVEQFYISRADCLADDELTFELRITNPNPANTFEVWVSSGGEDCTQFMNRSGDDALCWKVFQSTIAIERPSVSIPVQNIAAQEFARQSGGAISTGTVEDCDNNIETGITLYFLHVNGSEASGVNWATRLDLKGPVAPEDVQAGVGDRRLVVTWDASVGDIQGYRIYCEESPGTIDSARFALGQGGVSSPVGGTTGIGGIGIGGSDIGIGGNSIGTGGGFGGTGVTQTSDAGVVVTPSTGGTGTETSTPACLTTTLIEGVIPSPDAEECGRINTSTSERGTASGLSNGTLYAVGVSAVDDLGNPGPMSAISCERPQDLQEFFEAYRDLGGQGGGGFCSIPSRSHKAPFGSIPFGLGLFFTLAGIAAATRRRR